MAKLYIKGNVWIETHAGHLIGPGRKHLLEKIAETGSIRAAAKELNMSYRHAWEMINAMNEVSKKPVIRKSTGGAKGGGTEVTPEGMRWIEKYEKILQKFDKFMKKIQDEIN